MERLSLPIEEMRSHYSVLVVGSGYGGAINAARIARAGQDVCILERGKELHPGEYPRSSFGALREAQWHSPTSNYGSATGMFDFHVGPDMSILVGCGLGGTSLINANVALEPDPSIFRDDCWPAELQDPEVLQPFMTKARKMLGSKPYPSQWPELPRMAAMQRAAAGVQHEVTRPRLNVTFTTGKNSVGVEQRACVLCGDCCTGCNYGAKNTVLMNYLPDARAHGAHIFTEVAVRSVRRDEGKWRVAFDVLGTWRHRRETTPSQSVTADVVVLAAGTLGSTEILLRSRNLGLPLSDWLGRRFSGNGDVLAFAYDTDMSVRGVGIDGGALSGDTRIGPTIAGMIDLRDEHADPRNALIIEDGAIPGALAPILPLALYIAAYKGRTKTRDLRRLRELAGIPLGSYRGATDRTLTYLIMSTDDSGGRIVLADDRARVEWPGVGHQPVFERDDRITAMATEALRGIPVPDPLWAWTKGRSLITVHPIGGCVMADDVTKGVVDHLGRVFDPAGGVHEGLYVSDGSVIPRALDANPLLTISAIAERTAAMMIEDRQWAVGVTRPSSTVVPVPAQAPDQHPLTFSEHLGGFMSTHSPCNFQDGFERGRHDGAIVELFLTIAYDDVRAVLADPTKAARISGTVRAPELSPHRLTVVDGRFTLHDPSEGGTWHQRYQMDLMADDGKRFVLDGYKVIPKKGPSHVWDHLTTLYTTVTERDGPTRATGILHLQPLDLIMMLRSFDVAGLPRWKRAEYILEFFEHFAVDVVHVCAGGLADIRASAAAPKTEPARIRPKDADEIWWCDGNDQWHAGSPLPTDPAFLRLTRYHAGDKGPVMLASGFAMSSHSFLTATIDKNLTEFLAERGYDVWLFDYRAAIDLQSASTPFTIDDIARHDWPHAVRHVLERTGRDNVQALGHCVGSLSLQMAILSGMPGVRSAVCAQTSVHQFTSGFNLLKSDLRIANVLGGSGIRSLAPDRAPSLQDVLLDGLFRILPMPRRERCGQPICYWINAIYGCTHRHAQLNDATHRALNEMFGVGSTTALEHLTLMLRKRRAVTHTGDNDYFEHPEHFARTKLLLVQGQGNYIFHPEGTRQTQLWLRRHNRQGHYERIVLPHYAHLDAIIGARAATDVYPQMAEFLDRTQ